MTVNKKYPLSIYGWNHKRIVSDLEHQRKDPYSKLNKMAQRCGDDIMSWDMNSKVKLIDTDHSIYIRTLHVENTSEKNKVIKLNKLIPEIDLTNFSLDMDKIEKTNKSLNSHIN